MLLPNPQPRITRRSFLAAAALTTMASTGCVGGGPSTEPERVWGGHGVTNGKFYRPRAMTLGPDDELYIVDMTGRIQVFTPQGEFIRDWRTPTIAQGKPSGLAFDQEGRLMVADTHYFRVLFYTPEGQLLEDRTIGGVNGHGPGEFNFVTHARQDSLGNYYVAEYGEYDRVQKFSPQREFICQWGGHGEEVGQFIRPQKMAIDEQNHIWVTDACNHRIQVFDASGDQPQLVKVWGRQGRQLGDLCYPYDLALDGQGHVYVCEFGNHRVQKLTLDGQPVGSWGVQGRRAGQLHNPWALALDRGGRVHVLDTYNHRVQTIRL